MKYLTFLLICAILSTSMARRLWNGAGQDPGTAPVGNVGGNGGGTWVGPGQLGGGGRDPGAPPVGNVGGGNVGVPPVGNVGGSDPGRPPVGNVNTGPGYFGVGNPNVYGQPGRL